MLKNHIIQCLATDTLTRHMTIILTASHNHERINVAESSYAELNLHSPAGHIKTISFSQEDHCHVGLDASVKARNKIAKRKLFAVCYLALLVRDSHIGGVLAHSISIRTDAAHMIADTTGFNYEFSCYICSEKGMFFYHNFTTNMKIDCNNFKEPTCRMSLAATEAKF